MGFQTKVQRQQAAQQRAERAQRHNQRLEAQHRRESDRVKAAARAKNK